MTYVHDTTVNVAKLLQPKESCAMSGVIEDETLSVVSESISLLGRHGAYGGLIDWDSASFSSWIWLLADTKVSAQAWGEVWRSDGLPRM